MTSDLMESLREESSWEKKYKKIIDLGKKLEPLPQDFKKDQLLVQGCQSKVWLYASLDEQGKMLFKGESDALIVQGLLALLIEHLKGRSPLEVLNTTPDFLAEIGLDQHLSPNRSNGLYSMLKQMRYYAQAFQVLKK